MMRILDFHTFFNTTAFSSRNDNKLRAEFNYIKKQANSRLWGRCQSIVKQILCQRCSPNAAHIYDAKSSGKVRDQIVSLCVLPTIQR